jgi:hypothetical protein
MGEGPVYTAAGPIEATTAAAFWRAAPIYPDPATALVAFVERAGGVTPGALRLAAGPAQGPVVIDPTPLSRTGALAEGLDARAFDRFGPADGILVAFADRLGAGPRWAKVISIGDAVTPVFDEQENDPGPPSPGVGAPNVVAFDVATPAGRRVMVGGSSPQAVDASGQRGSAVVDCCLDVGLVRYAPVAWLEGGAVPQVAAALWSGPWLEVSQSLNADPAIAAESPTAYRDWLAWVEGGILRAGRFQASPVGLLRLDPPTVGVARWPRFLGGSNVADPVLVYVAAGPAGDTIEALRLGSGAAWERLAPANEGVVGEVRSLIAAGSMVTWTDALGRVYARRLNR